MKTKQQIKADIDIIGNHIGARKPGRTEEHSKHSSRDAIYTGQVTDYDPPDPQILSWSSVMAKYVSMLRGINVAGQKKVKMDDLKSLYVHLGLTDVATYIQSGNVVFGFNSAKEDFLKALIEKEIEQQYGFFVSVHNCSHDELRRIIKNFPFDRELADAQGNKYHVTFLSQTPEKSAVAAAQDVAAAGERLIVRGAVAYLHCPGSYGKSKLSNNFLEKKLQVAATTRNWKTILKLFELST